MSKHNSAIHLTEDLRSRSSGCVMHMQCVSTVYGLASTHILNPLGKYGQLCPIDTLYVKGMLTVYSVMIFYDVRVSDVKCNSCLYLVGTYNTVIHHVILLSYNIMRKKSYT